MSGTSGDLVASDAADRFGCLVFVSSGNESFDRVIDLVPGRTVLLRHFKSGKPSGPGAYDAQLFRVLGIVNGAVNACTCLQGASESGAIA